VTTESVSLTDTGIDLAAGLETAEGSSADVSADLFAFGAVLYELTTGRKIRAGGTPFLLESTGLPEVDRLIARCLGVDPATRLSSMQKALLELKLVALSAHNTEASASRPDPPHVALRAEMRELEVRLNARLEERESAEAARAQAAGEAMVALRDGSATTEQLKAAQEGVQANASRLAVLGQTVETLGQGNAALAAKLATDIEGMKALIDAQGKSIESIRASMAQADDLIERVVEAMETIQDHLLDPNAPKL